MNLREIGFHDRSLDGTVSRSCPMVGFVNGVEPSSFFFCQRETVLCWHNRSVCMCMFMIMEGGQCAYTCIFLNSTSVMLHILFEFSGF